MMDWREWATNAAMKIDSLGISDQKLYRKARGQLADIIESGDQPHMSLRAFVAIQLGSVGINYDNMA